jgi:serine protease Do/serine protease DegQ
LLLLTLGLLAHGVAARVQHGAARADTRDGDGELHALERSVVRAVEAAAPSLLKVRPRSGEPEDLARHTRSAIALSRSTAVLDASAIATTGTADLVVEDAQGRVFGARLAGRDQRLHVQALVIEGDGLVPARRCGRSPASGTFVVATGAVLMSRGRPSASLGIVSAPARLEGRVLQVDCGIDASNSGGALVDLEGRLVGVPVLLDRKHGDDSGVGFAVPVARVDQVISRLAAGEELRQAYLGIRVPARPPMLPVAVEDGVRIDGLAPEGSAKRAGLEVDDVIVRLDERRVRTTRGFLAILSTYCGGDPVRVTVRRGTAEVTKPVVLGSR